MNTPIEQIKNALTTIAQKVGVVSTISNEGKPEAAVVYFSIDENLDIYFTTRSLSRKYKNIAANPFVAFVVYSEMPAQTIQLEGTATAITDPAKQASLFSEVAALANEDTDQPPIDQIQNSEIMFIKVTTTWARLGNFEIKRVGEMFTEIMK
jgi:general stress protein 26